MHDLKPFPPPLPDFYHPFKEDEFEQSTVVDIMFPSEPPVRIHFLMIFFTVKAMRQFQMSWQYPQKRGKENKRQGKE